MMTGNTFYFNKRLQTWAIFSMILLCNVAIVTLFLLHENSFSFPKSWTYQFLAILLFNFQLSLMIFLIPKLEKKYRGLTTALLFVLQFGCKYIMTKPFSMNIWFEFFLVIIILLEGILLLSIPENFLLTTFVLLSILFTNHNEIFWGVEVGKRTWEIKSSLLILTFLLSSLCLIIKVVYTELIRSKEIQSNQKKIIEKLSTSNTQLQQYANMAEEKSMINERLKLTREIHDTVGYTMTNLLMMMEASTDLLKTSPGKLERLLHQALNLIKNGHREMRVALRELRNTKVKEKSCIESIQTLIHIFEESTGVKVKVEFGNLPWILDPKIDHIIYRFLQEAMTNSLTHGDAKRIGIHFRINKDLIYITMEDDGKGSTSLQQGIGLRGMIERLAEVSGVLSYENTTIGFSISAVIPWSRNE